MKNCEEGLIKLIKAVEEVVRQRDERYGKNSDIHPEILELKDALYSYQKLLEAKGEK